MTKNPHAVALGRLGGRANKGITSTRKRLSSQRNGRKGGWWSWHDKAAASKADRLRGARVHARVEADKNGQISRISQKPQ